MKTQRLEKNELEKAAQLIKEGETVAFPTDTVYGLGADALNEEAVQKIFKAIFVPIFKSRKICPFGTLSPI